MFKQSFEYAKNMSIHFSVAHVSLIVFSWASRIGPMTKRWERSPYCCCVSTGKNAWDIILDHEEVNSRQMMVVFTNYFRTCLRIGLWIHNQPVSAETSPSFIAVRVVARKLCKLFFSQKLTAHGLNWRGTEYNSQLPGTRPFVCPLSPSTGYQVTPHRAYLMKSFTLDANLRLMYTIADY